MEKKIHGDSETRSQNGEVESHIHIHVGEDRSRPADLDELAAGARRRLDELTERATDFAGRIRDSARQRFEQAGVRGEGPSGLLEFVRDRPLTALGVVFTAGFVAGFASSSGNHNWAVERARRRARTMIIGGLTAALAQELRSAIGEAGFGQLLANDEDQDLDDEDPDDLDELDDEGEFDA